MLEKLMQTSLKNRYLVVLCAFALLLAGYFVINDLPIDVFPDLTAPTVTILTEAHGMAPEEVEMLVTFPIETAVNGASGVRRVRSTSIQGFSTVFVEFKWGTDIYEARQIVTEKLQTLKEQLPSEVDPPILAPVSSIMGEIMTVGLTSNSRSQMELRTMAQFPIRRRLLALPGVARVKVYGGEVKQYQVLVNPNLLRKYKLSLHDVREAVSKTNKNAAGGFYVHSGKEYLIRGLGRIHHISELEKVVIETRENAPILLRDVAEIRIGSATKIGTASINLKNGILLVINKQPEINTLDLTNRLITELDAIRSSLPEDIDLHDNLFRQALFIERAVENVVVALRDGALLVIVVLFLFLGNLRTSIISMLAIPLSLVISFIFLKLMGLSVNTMTLGGMAIAIGVLVDDAIIYVENVHRRLRQNASSIQSSQERFLGVVADASSKVRTPISIATFIVVVVFLPLFFLSGLEGRMLQPLGLAYVVSVLASLLVAATVTPALSALLLRRVGYKKTESPVVHFFKRLYKPVLIFSLTHRKMVLFVAVILILMAVSLIPFMGHSFLPEFNEGALNISIATVPGTSLEESSEIGRMAERILRDHPAVSSVSRRTGRTEMDEHSLGSHAAEVEARIDFSQMSKEKVLQDLREQLDLLPGTVYVIGQPISHRIDHMLSGTRANIAVKIFGKDLSMLREVAGEVRQKMSTIQGIADLSVDQQVDIPQVRVRANHDKMAVYGLTMEDIHDVIHTAFLGEEISQVFEGQNQFDLIVRYNKPFRDDLNALRNSIVHTPLGADIPLAMVADIHIDRGPNYISRENVQRKMVVRANVAGRDAGGVVENIEHMFANDIDLPTGYFYKLGGQFASEKRATRIISLLSVVSLLLIFFALIFEFKNVSHAFLILLNLPLALIGGIVAIMITGGVMSIASLVGFISLFGIAVRNGIILIGYYNDLLSKEKNVWNAVVNGSLERLSPILMTALTTGLALTPLAFAGSKPGNEIQAPLAVVILGGLITSTLLTLIVLPVIFQWLESKKESKA